jgi:phospholipase C
VSRRLAIALPLTALAVATGFFLTRPSEPHARAISHAGIHKIRHVVIVMQENRSFDSYFGTYPGADGLPRRNGKFTVCSPDPRSGRCMRPFHDHLDRNLGGPHEHLDAMRDMAHGKMDGFVREARRGLIRGCLLHPTAPICSLGARHPDVMGYHDRHEIPNYWAYARHFVLQDHMFQPDTSWSLPAHLFMVSEWSARCYAQHDPTSCVNAVENPVAPPHEIQNPTGERPDYAWTDLTCCTSTASPGATTCSRARSRTARRARWSAPPSASGRRRPGSGTRCRGSTRCATTTSSAT